MTEHRWYGDPQEPGAPQVGDLVVAVGQWDTNWHRSWVGHVKAPRSTTGWGGHGMRHLWVAVHRGPSAHANAHHVRRLTEAELAAWVLDGCPSCQEPTTIQWPPVITPAPGNVHGSPCEHAPHTA